MTISLEPQTPPHRTPRRDPSAAGATGLSRGDFLLALVACPLVIAVAATVGPLAAVGALGVGVYIVFCLRRPQLIGYTLVAIVPITSGLARGLPVPGFRITEVMIVASAAVVLPRQIGRSGRTWQVLDWAAFGYVGCSVLLVGFSGTMNNSLSDGGVNQLLGPIQFFLLYRTVSATLTTSEERERGLRLLLLMTIPVALLAVAQYAGVPGVQDAVKQITETEAFDLYTYDTTRRATGPFAAWHPLAGYLFFPMITAVAVALQKNSKILSRRLAVGVLLLAIAALVVSQTLNVLAGVIAAALIVAAMKGVTFRFIAVMVLLTFASAVVFAPVLSQRIDAQRVSDPIDQSGVQLPETIQYRIDVWQDQYFPAIANTWMTGYGANLPPEITWRSTESLYFTLLLRGGVMLLGSFIVLMGVVLRQAFRRRRSEDDLEQAISLALGAGIIALIPMHAVFPYFTASGLPQVFWILLALLPIATGRRAKLPH